PIPPQPAPSDGPDQPDEPHHPLDPIPQQQDPVNPPEPERDPPLVEHHDEDDEVIDGRTVGEVTAGQRVMGEISDDDLFAKAAREDVTAGGDAGGADDPQVIDMGDVDQPDPLLSDGLAHTTSGIAGQIDGIQPEPQEPVDMGEV